MLTSTGFPSTPCFKIDRPPTRLHKFGMGKYLALLIAAVMLTVSGCATSQRANKWEYKTVILRNNSQADPLRDPNDGWEDSDGVINEMAKDDWVVAGYALDQTTSQWFLLKRRIK